MITYERVKTNIFATIFGLFLGIVYLYFYINGYFGQAGFSWEFLSGLLISFIHPIALIGLVPFLIHFMSKYNGSKGSIVGKLSIYFFKSKEENSINYLINYLIII